MNLLSKLFGNLTPRGRALAAYRRGMQRAGERDLEGAIVEYTMVVEMKDAPEDVIAMALLNRALAYSRAHDDDKAGADLDRVLHMPAASKQVLHAAHEKLHRMERRVSPKEQHAQ
ncbi:MAG: hypothetical protein ACQESR_21210 [Planctomycetota bacterium]